MQTLDCKGSPLRLGLFIRAYQEALRLSPGRFLTLRIHPDTWHTIVADAEEITHVVHSTEILGPLGRRLIKVACVPAPKAIGEGVTVAQDKEIDRRTMVFEIHGAPELEVINIGAPALPEFTEECLPTSLQ